MRSMPPRAPIFTAPLTTTTWRGKRIMKTTSLVALLSLALSCASSARGETLEWIRQFGTSSLDECG